MKVAVASKGLQKLEDEVSEVFGRAKTFTIVEVEDGEVKDVRAVENPAASYDYGAGPIAVKMLADLGVKAVVGSEFGVGIMALLKDMNLKSFKVPAGIKVKQALEEFLKSEGI